MQHLLSLVVVFALATSSDARQVTRALVDMGTTTFPTDGTVAQNWNDVDNTNMATPFVLSDTAGASTGVQWALSGPLFTGSNSSGTAAPTPGSQLSEFPPSATRDVLYGQSGGSVEIELSGLTPNTLVSITFAASRLNVTDNRSTDYIVQGFNSGTATLNPSNNTTNTVRVESILPDSLGKITITMRAASANTNSNQYFYIGALAINLETTVGVPQILGFDQSALNFSLDEAAAPFSTNLSVLESTGVFPSVTLAALDDATGLPATWLSVPAGATAGTPFSIGLDTDSLAIGAYSAKITATASGYPDARIAVSLTIKAPGGLNLLFYGNSYSQGNSGVPQLAGFIAEEAGFPAPNVVAQLVGGQNLFYHLTNPTQAAAIAGSLPLGQEWDFVIMQGFSLEATEVFGNPAQFRANALAILTNVRAHSPNAKAVMYQTWARGPGYSAYPGSYAAPYDMHVEIHANYQLAVDDMNAAFGAGTAFRAAAGDAVALLSFDPSLYVADQSHPTAPTSMMAAMAIYQAIYRARTCDVDPDFGSTSNLINRLTSLGLDADDWLQYGSIAERVADNDVRRWPGSSEDLLLASGVNSIQSSCPVKTAGKDDVLTVAMTSPVGLYSATHSFIFIDPYPTGGTPGAMNEWPEVHFNTGSSFIAKQAMMLPASLNYQGIIPDNFPGLSLRIQGISAAPSAVTGNLIFTITDGHEIILQ